MAAETKYAELLAEGRPFPAEAFIQNFSGCSSYPHFYVPGSHCEYENLCRVQDYRDMTGYYVIKPEHRMVDLTVGGS